jgi:hypothetical protein
MIITKQPLSRRTLLQGAGVALSLPLLEAMMPLKASAATGTKRFFGFFYPNGTDPSRWQPATGKLTAQSLSPCLQDLAGFKAEGIWPACDALYDYITVVNGINHEGLNTDIHTPSMALQAYTREANADASTPVAPSLDVKIAQKFKGAYPYLAMSSSTDTALTQGYISWEGKGRPADTQRDPAALFKKLFGAQQNTPAATAISQRQASVLDFIQEDCNRLKSKLGQADKQRVDEFFNSVRTLEEQLNSVAACQAVTLNGTGRDFHDKSKFFIDIGVLAMACGLTNVATVQYSNSWGVNYAGYVLGDGVKDEAGTIGVGNFSDHFISHKLDDTDRAKDLDALPRATAVRIADNRVVLTSRFKVRRFAYLVDALRKATTPTGNLYDETLALYCSENGNGDSHSRRDMPTLLAGRAGGFEPGRVINSNGARTAALHGAILNRFDFNLTTYGDPAAAPLAGI